jgi:hypothetical protein
MKSIYSILDIKKGDLLTKDNIKIIRPANGLRPYFFNSLINKKSPELFNLFEYYDPVKRRFLSETECVERCKSERNKYVKDNKISLRDVLIYLYHFYNMLQSTVLVQHVFQNLSNF